MSGDDLVDQLIISDVPLDELVVGDGSRDYDLLTSSHPDESIDEAVSFAKSLTGEHAGDVQIVEL